MLDDLHRAQSARAGGKEINNAGGKIESVDILFEGAFDAGAKDLDGDVFARAGQFGLVNLCDRSGGNRIAEITEDFGHRLPQFLFHFGHCSSAGKRGKFVL